MPGKYMEYRYADCVFRCNTEGSDQTGKMTDRQGRSEGSEGKPIVEATYCLRTGPSCAIIQKMRKILLMLLCLALILHSVSADADDAVLSVGDRGERVLEIKKRLQELRYLSDTSLTKKYTEKTADAVRSFQKQNGLPETGTVDEETERILFSDGAASKPYPTLKPLATPAPTPVPDWPQRDREGFLAGDGEYIYENDSEGLWVYLSSRLQIVITARQDSSIPLEWFETEIRTRDGEAFYSVLTDPDHPGRKFQYPYVIAREAKCVLAFSDDFFATRLAGKETVGIIIRNGTIISSTTNRKTGHHLPNLDMMAQYPDGRLEVYECNEYTAEELLEMGAVNVYSFGPILIRDGAINELLYRYYKSIEPRHALGMIQPGHYLLISVQGRTKGSKGTVLQRVAEMMKEHGVMQALNLDGGNTMALVFCGRMLNKLAVYRKRSFVRTVTSVIGIGHTDHQADE